MAENEELQTLLYRLQRETDERRSDMAPDQAGYEEVSDNIERGEN